MGKWHLIQSQPFLREIFKESPLISFKRRKISKLRACQSKNIERLHFKKRFSLLEVVQACHPLLFPTQKKDCWRFAIVKLFYISSTFEIHKWAGDQVALSLLRTLIHVKCVKMIEEQVIFLKCAIKLRDVVFWYCTLIQFTCRNFFMDSELLAEFFFFFGQYSFAGIFFWELSPPLPWFLMVRPLKGVKGEFAVLFSICKYHVKFQLRLLVQLAVTLSLF